MILIVSFLFFSGYHTAAVSVEHQTGKSKLVFSLSLFLAPVIHYLLNRIKKFLGSKLACGFPDLLHC